MTTTNYNIQFLNSMGSTNASKPIKPEKEKLDRQDFQKKTLKGGGDRYYFSFLDPYAEAEVCLEPCLNGFCIGLYDATEGSRTNELLRKKECTDMNLGEDFFKKELFQTQQRDQSVWDKALEIANRFLMAHRNLITTEKMGLWKRKGYDPLTTTPFGGNYAGGGGPYYSGTATTTTNTPIGAATWTNSAGTKSDSSALDSDILQIYAQKIAERKLKQ